MMGTFGGALEARQIDASEGKLTAEVTGEVEQEEGVLAIRRIHVLMRRKGRGKRWSVCMKSIRCTAPFTARYTM